MRVIFIVDKVEYYIQSMEPGEPARTARRRPARQRAREYVAGAAERLRGQGLERLPTVPQLARAASVSQVTMLRAVRLLRDEGVLTVSHGKGIRLAAGPMVPVPVPPRERRPYWEETLARIEQDIVAGGYGGDGTLPTPKEMRHRYGVSHRTLRRALDRLVADGVVFPYRRTYRVAAAARQTAERKRVLFVTRTGDTGDLALAGSRAQGLFLALESACARRGLRLGRSAAGTRVSRASAPQSVLGSVVWAGGHGPSELAQLLPRLPDGPVAVVFQVAPEAYRSALRPSRRVQVFSVANSSLPGERMGSYVRGLGHRRVAYISPIFRTPWARNRLAGLKATFEGDGRRVAAVTRDHLPEDDERGGVAGAFEIALDTFREVSRATKSRRHLVPFCSAVERSSVAVHTAFGREFLYRSLLPMFEEALMLDDVTAWVAHNDVVGLRALEFLKRRGVRSPAQLSLVGFDNTADASEAGLTSYDFNLDALARVLADYMVGGTIWRRAHVRSDEIEVEGVVVERDTSGRVGSRKGA